MDVLRSIYRRDFGKPTRQERGFDDVSIALKKSLTKSRVPWGGSYTPTMWSEEAGTEGAGAYSARETDTVKEYYQTMSERSFVWHNLGNWAKQDEHLRFPAYKDEAQRVSRRNTTGFRVWNSKDNSAPMSSTRVVSSEELRGSWFAKPSSRRASSCRSSGSRRSGASRHSRASGKGCNGASTVLAVPFSSPNAASRVPVPSCCRGNGSDCAGAIERVVESRALASLAEEASQNTFNDDCSSYYTFDTRSRPSSVISARRNIVSQPVDMSSGVRGKGRLPSRNSGADPTTRRMVMASQQPEETFSVGTAPPSSRQAQRYDDSQDKTRPWPSTPWHAAHTSEHKPFCGRPCLPCSSATYPSGTPRAARALGELGRPVVAQGCLRPGLCGHVSDAAKQMEPPQPGLLFPRGATSMGFHRTSAATFLKFEQDVGRLPAPPRAPPPAPGDIDDERYGISLASNGMPGKSGRSQPLGRSPAGLPLDDCNGVLAFADSDLESVRSGLTPSESSQTTSTRRWRKLAPPRPSTSMGFADPNTRLATIRNDESE